MKKAILIFIVVLFLCLCTVGWLYYTGIFGPHLILRKATFARLPGWRQQNQVQAFKAFRQSCDALSKREATTDFSDMPHSGKVSEWQKICFAATYLKKINQQTTKQFFEEWFIPYRVTNNLNQHGLFTGYYLPLLHGNLVQTKRYHVPIYALPTDLIKVNLGLFHPDMVGRSIVGQLKEGILSPYPDREAINQGVIHNKADVLVWADSVLDVFFAQIQGSAIVQLPHHRRFLMSYAGSNGQAYLPIGKVLVEKKVLTLETVSMQTIRAWLLKHPKQMEAVLNRNPSYVFFRSVQSTQPIGAEQIPLTPQHSLAVDTDYIPLGAPLWLESTIPLDTKPQKSAIFRQLLIAQDTGGAVKGIVRGDVYWGAGAKAAFTAGHMKNRGRYWILLPVR